MVNFIVLLVKGLLTTLYETRIEMEELLLEEVTLLLLDINMIQQTMYFTNKNHTLVGH